MTDVDRLEIEFQAALDAFGKALLRLSSARMARAVRESRRANVSYVSAASGVYSAIPMLTEAAEALMHAADREAKG